MNKFDFIGRLTNDIELRFTPGGLAIGKVSIAVDRTYSREKKEQLKKENKPTADFPRITMTGKVAENASRFLKKGSLVAVEGSVRTTSYENAEKQKIYSTDFFCDRVHFLENAKKDESSLSTQSAVDVQDFEIEEVEF